MEAKANQESYQAGTDHAAHLRMLALWGDSSYPASLGPVAGQQAMKVKKKPSVTTVTRAPSQFDPHAVGELASRFLWWLAQRDKSRKKSRGKARRQ